MQRVQRGSVLVYRAAVAVELLPTTTDQPLCRRFCRFGTGRADSWIPKPERFFCRRRIIRQMKRRRQHAVPGRLQRREGPAGRKEIDGLNPVRYPSRADSNPHRECLRGRLQTLSLEEWLHKIPSAIQRNVSDLFLHRAKNARRPGRPRLKKLKEALTYWRANH